MKDLINTKLEKIRKEYKLTRKGLEEISGFKERTIGAYERGENYPPKEYIEFMCLFFGYIEDYFKKERYSKIDKFVNKILMYQSIFNYDDKKMADLLNMTLEDYIKKFNLNMSEVDCKNIVYTPNQRFIIAESLGIKPSIFSGRLEDEKKSIISNIEKIEYQKLVKIYPEKSYQDIKILLHNDDFTKIKNEALKDILKRENEAEIKGINLTREYYSSIIKQRNQPEIITPDTQKETIPDKYKEILELLPYASDSFTQNLKNKLLELKNTQQIEDL